MTTPEDSPTPSTGVLDAEVPERHVDHLVSALRDVQTGRDTCPAGP